MRSALHTEMSREMSGAARDAVLALARFFFPTLCLACRRRRVDRLWKGGVCSDCWSALSAPAPHRCATCDDPLAEEHVTGCGRCLLEPPPFSALVAAAPYRGAAREILLAFKFRGADYLAHHLAAVMSDRLGRPAEIREVTAVPATRRARRGRDHAAELLGAAVAARLNLPFAPARLVKVRETERQSRLPFARRAANVRGAFRARGAASGPVLLVDDVATSGATARECAARLREAGAPSVLVWCFARASRHDVDLEPPDRDAAEN
jgi:predicted amidophosphoribosyltransferase